MGTTKLNIGKIPISKGEYQEGTAYQRLNQVTMLGSTYQSKIDDDTSAPAQMGADGAVENINTDKWLCIAVGNVSAARKVVYNNETSGLEAGNVQEAIDELANKKFDKESVAQESGDSEELVMSQKAVSDKLSGISVGLESFKEKTILCLGDSITHDGLYTTPLSSLLDAKIINRGSSGSSIAIKGNNISFVERVQLPQSDESGTALGMPTKADVVIFYGGVNDWMASSVDFGTTKEGENTDTFCGSVFFVFNKLKQYYPNASFFVVNNYNVYSPNVFPTVSEIKYADNEDGVYEYVRNTQGRHLMITEMLS